MEMNHPYQHFYAEVRPFLKSKYEEFRMYGIKEVSMEDIWLCLVKKKWKKPKESTHLYEVAADIISLTSSQYMTYKTVQAYRSISSEDLEEVLKK